MAVLAIKAIRKEALDLGIISAKNRTVPTSQTTDHEIVHKILANLLVEEPYESTLTYGICGGPGDGYLRPGLSRLGEAPQNYERQFYEIYSFGEYWSSFEI